MNGEATGGIGANNAQVYDEELEFQDDDSDGSVEELDLGDVDQGEEDEEDGISPPQTSGERVRKNVRIPPPSGFKHNFNSLADELGELPAHHDAAESVTQDVGAESGDVWRESNIRHRSTALRNVK